MSKTLCQDCRFLDKTIFKNKTGRAYCRKRYENLSSYAIACRQYQSLSEPSLDDMYKSAWIITKSNKAGYVSPSFEFDKPEKEHIRRHYEEEDRSN
ncbi:MAG: hypothetical protein AABW88_00110 [Nanoarchaeota archaeon]|mgnify:CR=1 FL=1